MNNKGSSLIESIFLLIIIQVIFLTMMPLMTTMYESTLKLELKLIATQLAYNVVQLQKHSEYSSGTEVIENTLYKWQFDKKTICIYYNFKDEKEQYCVKV